MEMRYVGSSFFEIHNSKLLLNSLSFECVLRKVVRIKLGVINCKLYTWVILRVSF